MSYMFDLAVLASKNTGYSVDPKFIYAQWAHETGGFTSELCVESHNLAGLTQSTPSNLPQPDGSMFYMAFNSSRECASYFGNYLCYYGDDGIFQVKSIDDYCRVLKNGGYYGATYNEYLEGCSKWLATIL